MSNRQAANTCTIHPRALAELGEEACIVALGVARDLRSGVIPPEKFDMGDWCGSACCIAGHIATRLGRDQSEYYGGGPFATLGLCRLTSGNNPSDPQLAADAIERYVYDGSENPWQA